MRRRLALSALATLFTAALAVTGNVTTASADSSAPPLVAPQYSSLGDAQSYIGFGGPDVASNQGPFGGPDFTLNQGPFGGPDAASNLGFGGPDAAGGFGFGGPDAA